jgi:uncharacterized alpha/beta hydrolase family protein
MIDMEKLFIFIVFCAVCFLAITLPRGTIRLPIEEWECTKVHEKKSDVAYPTGSGGTVLTITIDTVCDQYTRKGK